MTTAVVVSMLAFGGVFDLTTMFWHHVASVLGAAAVWAQQRANPDRDPVIELTERLRHPIRHAAAHPIVTLRRKIDRRRSN